MSTPIYDRLRSYHAADRVSFAMPGHKNGRGLPEGLSDLDITELAATLDLNDSANEITSDAQKQLSALYTSDESYILTGGSTLGIQAMICAALKPGGVLLTGADCHVSVINTCAVCGFKLRFIPAALYADTLIPHDSADIDALLDKYRDVSAVLVTSPNYYGMCRDIKGFAEACHRRSIPLLVDEAHGAHFIASKNLPKPAITVGADAAVNSAHKTLNALTGAAYLHRRGTLIQKERLSGALSVFRSSSPSYPIAASADIARGELEDGAAWDSLISYCADFRNKLSASLFAKLVPNDDPTRIVINFTPFNTTGYEVGRLLADNYGIDIEMADAVNIVMIAAPSNTERDFERLYYALNEICAELDVRREPYTVLSPSSHDRLVNPQRALYSQSMLVSMTDSIGRTSMRTITAYPPGIPILCAGEEITTGLVVYLRHLKNRGARFTGFDGNRIEIIRN